MKTHQGFTLVELLVTISIIALLIGILLPAIGQARRTAADTECKARLGQIMLAQQMHATDHGVYTSIWNDDDGWFSESGPAPSKTDLAPYLNMSDKTLESGTDSVLQCPSVSDEELTEVYDDRFFGERPSSIGFNSAMYFQQWDFVPSRVPQTSRIIVVAEQAVEPYEGVLTADGIIGQEGSGYPFWDTISGHNPYRGYRHGSGSGSNVAMADGHVEHLPHESLMHESGHWFWWTLGAESVRPPSEDGPGCNCS